MNSDKIQLKLITPDATLFEQSVDEVRLPTELGQISVLPQHTYLVSILEPGELIVKADNKEFPLAVSGGVIEVFDDTLLVLADVAEHASDIDIAAAEDRAKKLAAEIEAETQLDLTNYHMLQRRLEMERVRIEVARKWKR